MELQLIQCKNCGAGFDVMPGLSRVACNYCGAIYNVIKSKDDTNYASNNNPCKLLIEPTKEFNSIKLGNIYSITAYPDTADHDFASITLEHHNKDKSWSNYYTLLPNSSAGYEINNDFKTVLDNLNYKMLFWASLSYLSGKTYRLVDQYELDVTPLYDNTPIISIKDDFITQAEISRLKKPNQIRLNTKLFQSVRLESGTTDCLDPKAGNYVLYDANQEKSISTQRRNNIMNFASKYGFETKQTTIYSLPYWEKAQIRAFIGTKVINRLWVVGIHKLTIARDMTPDFAKTILSDEMREYLDKLCNNQVIESIALEMSDTLNRGYERLLATQSSMSVSILLAPEKVILGTYIYDSQKHAYVLSVIDKASALENKGNNPSSWTFNHLGMKVIDKANVRTAFIAALYSRIMKLTTINETPSYAPVLFTGSTKQDYSTLRAGDDYMELKMVNAYKSKAVYDDWV